MSRNGASPASDVVTQDRIDDDSLRDCSPLPTHHESDNLGSSIVVDGTSSSNPTITMTKCSGSSANRSRSSNEDDGDRFDRIRAKLSNFNTSNILKLRFIALLLMSLVALALCVLTYWTASKVESNEFISQYESAAKKILHAFELIGHRASSISSVGLAATIHGMDLSGSHRWPFVTMSSFQQHSAIAREVSGSLHISIEPIVIDEDRYAWEMYVGQQDNKYWIKDSLEYQNATGMDEFQMNPPQMDDVFMSNETRVPIGYFDENQTWVIDSGPGPYLPMWQSAPLLSSHKINENSARIPSRSRETQACLDTKKAILSDMDFALPGTIHDVDKRTTAQYATLVSIEAGRETPYEGDAISRLYLPIYNSTKSSASVVAFLLSVIHWKTYFVDILPETIFGLTVVLEDCKEQSFTYNINGPTPQPIGPGDLHDEAYSSYVYETRLHEDAIYNGHVDGMQFDESSCIYSIRVYPSKVLYDNYHSNVPIFLTLATLVCFILIILVFIVYDRTVERRQEFVLNKAAQSTAIVSSLFPKQVRDRLLGDVHPACQKKESGFSKSGIQSLIDRSSRLNTFMSDGSCEMNKSAIADFFPHCTVLFADIAGFTAWSSTRDPEHVFILLQTLYHGFDTIAKRRKVFKVETIGDCYLAVTGLPDPQPNHALIMSRFAWECKRKMAQMVIDLEVTLGPDCSDLKLRFGMHSGPVTAGVLRGDRARFQLFGDTVNTASRMESSGVQDKIQMSQATADLITTAGKSQWVIPRTDLVDVKGKGNMQTYWLNPSIVSRESHANSCTGSNESHSHGTTQSRDLSVLMCNKNKPVYDEKHHRLVEWMVDILLDHIKKIIARRRLAGEVTNDATEDRPNMVYTPAPGSICLDEVQEVVEMERFNPNIVCEIDSTDVALDATVVQEMHSYVSIIASMYHHSNPFHNFEHACHVTMSVNKLLKRIVEPELTATTLEQIGLNKNGTLEEQTSNISAHLHKYTYGMTSDPLALFAIVFSALIHDVDHRGCSNTQLGKEEELLGLRYRNKSTAEQNSIDLSWSLLMGDEFSHLRSVLFSSEEELLRFRQFVVTTVLATDIFDKELNDLRRNRWAKVFYNECDESNSMNEYIDSDRRATIIIEHIIQASDVSHTMQHWRVYQKWNGRLFKELSIAFKNGRMSANPSSFWYEGELKFFDAYVIPLAKKLKECNVFGVSSDEYLNYAVGNRAEWLERGEACVAELVQEVEREVF